MLLNVDNVDSKCLIDVLPVESFAAVCVSVRLLSDRNEQRILLCLW